MDETEDDGRNPAWSEPTTLVWEAVAEHAELDEPAMARLVVALDGLDRAERLAADVDTGQFECRDRLMAEREIRANRQLAERVIAAITGRPNGTGWGGARPNSGPERKEHAHRRNGQ